MTDDERKFEGVKYAQVFVQPSYQWAISRSDAQDARITTLATFVATVTFAAPALVRSLTLSLDFGRSGSSSPCYSHSWS